MLDLIRKGNNINVQNSLGGVLINGKSPLDKESLIDLLYPRGMTFVFPSGFSPITQFGYGNWKEIADNVSLPIGGDAPVITKNGWVANNIIENTHPLFWRTTDGSTISNYNLTVQRNSVESSNGYTIGRGGNTDIYSPQLAPSNLYADLTNATNVQTVSIWKRTEED